MAIDAALGSNVDFDLFPFYDDLIKRNQLKMSDVWVAAFSSFIQTLQTYLSQNGSFLPQLTEAERDAIQLPVGGQMIYNLDTQLPQIFVYTSIIDPVQGDWKTFTVV